jgi:hypothetical protein
VRVAVCARNRFDPGYPKETRREVRCRIACLPKLMEATCILEKNGQVVERTFSNYFSIIFQLFFYFLFCHVVISSACNASAFLSFCLLTFWSILTEVDEGHQGAGNDRNFCF